MIGFLKRDFDRILTSPSFLQQQNKVMDNLHDIRNGIAVTTDRISDILNGNSPIFSVFGNLWLVNKRTLKKKKKTNKMTKRYKEDIQLIMRLGRDVKLNNQADSFYVDL